MPKEELIYRIIKEVFSNGCNESQYEQIIQRMTLMQTSYKETNLALFNNRYGFPHVYNPFVKVEHIRIGIVFIDCNNRVDLLLNQFDKAKL